MVLAVYHASPDVEIHLAALRRAGRFKLACYPQDRQALVLRSEDALDGVLWELGSGVAPDRRRLTRLARCVPVVSYSADAGRDVAALSRAIGFVSHLEAPLSPIEVEHRLALVTGGDLAHGLEQVQPALRRQLRRADVLADLVRTVTASVDPARVAELLIGLAAGWIPAATWGVFVTEGLGDPRLLASRAWVPAAEAGAHAAAHWTMHANQPYSAANMALDPRIAGGAPVAGLALPLQCRGRTIGALVALDRRPSAKPPRLARTTTALLNQALESAAIALDDAVRIERVEALSVTDDLTQLYNSRFLSQALRREAKRTTRSGRPLSLLFVDLDGFKSINDAHGHLFGSRALVEAGAVIRSSARETDLVSRFGGDEFAVVLPDTGGEGAVAVGERVRERIAAHAFLESAGLSIRLTASVGVATLPGAADSAEALIQAADRAMYCVKDRGKNGIHVATG